MFEDEFCVPESRHGEEGIWLRVHGGSVSDEVDGRHYDNPNSQKPKSVSASNKSSVNIFIESLFLSFTSPLEPIGSLP